MVRIAIEGIDGVGKTTLAEHLTGYLRNLRKNVLCLREPRVLRKEIMDLCGSPEADEHALSYLFMVDGLLCRQQERANAYDVLIRDRDTSISHYAYHHGFGVDDYFIFAMSWAVNFVNSVDYVFFLDAPVEIALARVQQRAEQQGVQRVNYFERADKMQRYRDNYQRFFENRNIMDRCGIFHAKVCVVDATQTPDAILHTVTETLKSEGIGVNQ